jgi:hypothetical protein
MRVHKITTNIYGLLINKRLDLELQTGSSCNFSNIPWAGNTRKNISMQTVKDCRWQFIPFERTRTVSHTN